MVDYSSFASACRQHTVLTGVRASVRGQHSTNVALLLCMYECDVLMQHRRANALS